jgi:hypothetical protein
MLILGFGGRQLLGECPMNTTLPDKRFEERQLEGGPGYPRDPRWQEVRRLKAAGKDDDAATLAERIKEDWNVN